MAAKKALNVAVGARIKAARKNARLTQEQLAETIGISAKNLSFIETGRFGVGLETLVKLCVALHVSADTLLFGQTADEPAILCRDLAALTSQQQEFAVQLLDLTLAYLQKQNSAPFFALLGP